LSVFNPQANSWWSLCSPEKKLVSSQAEDSGEISSHPTRNAPISAQ
jgi:hypothetical protein